MPGATTAAGYGADHQRERRRLKPAVDAGLAYCQQGLPGNGSSGRCLHRNRWIKPGTRWALGHTDDRTTWIGPTHWDCNQHDGARRGGQARARQHHKPPPQPWNSRTWGARPTDRKTTTP